MALDAGTERGVDGSSIARPGERRDRGKPCRRERTRISVATELRSVNNVEFFAPESYVRAAARSLPRRCSNDALSRSTLALNRTRKMVWFSSISERPVDSEYAFNGDDADEGERRNPRRGPAAKQMRSTASTRLRASNCRDRSRAAERSHGDRPKPERARQSGAPPGRQRDVVARQGGRGWLRTARFPRRRFYTFRSPTGESVFLSSACGRERAAVLSTGVR